MINLKNPLGRRVHVRISADVSSGAITSRGNIIGIPVENKLNGTTVVFIQEGLVALTLAIGGTINAGSFLYWNRGSTPTANALSLGAAAGDIEVAQVLEQISGTSYLCRLNVGFPRAAAGNAQ